MTVIRFLFLLTLLLTMLTSMAVVQADSPRERIKEIQNYIVYYGTGREDDLVRYDLAIIQPGTLTSDQLVSLKARGTLVVAYLSIGEAEPGRPWYSDGRVDPRWLLDENQNWGSYFVDANQPGWQDLMVQLTGEFIGKGFDGVFLDTVDTVDAYPDTLPGMVQLIHQLRSAYPAALLVQNRGFTIINQVESDLDALMFEDLSTSYDFTSQRYLYQDDSYTAQQMAKISQRNGLVILALDYAPPDNPAMAYRAVQTAQHYGFIPAVSVINLDDIPDYGLDKGGPPDIRVSSISVEGNGANSVINVVVENVGLTDAVRVPISLTIDGNEIATTTRDTLAIGEQYHWRVAWDNPPQKAQIRATAFSLQDDHASNNNSTFLYASENIPVEPLLPLDQQRLRPDSNGPTMIAPELNTPPTIDGDLSDWGSMPCTEVNRADQISFGSHDSWKGADDLSGRVCYAWDNELLYLCFQIVDDVIVQKYTGTNIWHGDHVELWFDTQLQLDFDNAQADADDFQIGLSQGNFKDVPPDIFIWTPPTLMENYQSIQYAVKQTDNGYSAEMAIPALVLTGLRLAPDHAIGATFDPSDTDTPDGSDQETMLSTAPHTQWGVPTLWNNLILSQPANKR